MDMRKTYSSIVLLVFLRNKGRSTNSIQQAIDFSDMQLKKLDIKSTLSYTTKYRIVKEMISAGILESTTKKYGYEGVSLSKTIEGYFKGGKNEK